PAGSLSASATAARDVGTSVPMVSTRVTPAWRARASVSARSASKSGKCRCACVSNSSTLMRASQQRPSRRDTEAQAADQLTRRRRDVHRPASPRVGGKAGLARKRPIALAAAAFYRRQADDVDDLALQAPDVIH